MSQNYKRKIGDRSDGRRIRTLDPYHAMSPFIMKKRNDANNTFFDKIEVSDVDRYLRKLRVEEKVPGLGMLHLLTAVYLRTCAKYPEINRFVAGQRIYARFNPELVMSIKVEMKADSPETSIKVPLEVTDTILDVYRKINEQVDTAKQSVATNTDDAAAIFMKIPRVILKVAIKFFDILDYFGVLPKTLIKASPFHGSVIITDLGSIGLPAVAHHLYNFGNLPMFISLGAKYKEYETDKNGEVAERKYVDFTLTIDERVTDGFYFSQVYRFFKYLLKHPEELTSPPSEVKNDIP